MEGSTPSTPTSSNTLQTPWASVGGTLKRQARAVVFNTYTYLERKKKEEKTKINVRELTSEITGVSSRCVARILQEGRLLFKDTGSVKFATPSKSKPHRKRIALDSFDDAVLRKKIRQFYLNKRFPTTRNILESLKEDGAIDCGAEFLRLKIKACGFEWKRCQNNRKLLVERSDIGAWRARYLRTIRKYRSEGKNIVYLDETDHFEGLIIVHGGGEMGFVPNSLLIFRSSSKSGDNSAMKFDNFSKWLEETFLPNLPERSVVVLDNAAYHDVELNQKPNTGSLRKDVVEWLTKNNINFEEEMTKAELLELARAAPVEKMYKVDTIIHNHGHEAVHLPLYHPDLNPIKMVWGYLKNKLAMESVGTPLCVKETHLKKLFSDYSAEQWKKVCGKVVQNEQQYIDRDHRVEEMVENFINLEGHSDSSDFDSNEEE